MKKSILFISIISLISVSIVALILFINRNKNELTINDGSNNEIIESNSSIEEEEILDENITESIEDDASGVKTMILAFITLIRMIWRAIVLVTLMS